MTLSFITNLLWLPFRLRFLLIALPGLVLPGILLTGCNSPGNPQRDSQQQITMPEKQVTNFLLTRCADIRKVQGAKNETNTLFWLRVIDCSQRLNEQQARQQADNQLSSEWPDMLYRAIVLEKVTMAPDERQQYMTYLNQLASQIPPSLWPLFQLWRKGSLLQMEVHQQVNRYHKLQQTTDNELDTLRQQLQDVYEKLNQTTRKLETLTDIERKLSTRKASEGDIQSGAHSGPTEEKSATNPAAKDSPAPATEKEHTQ